VTTDDYSVELQFSKFYTVVICRHLLLCFCDAGYIYSKNGMSGAQKFAVDNKIETLFVSEKSENKADIAARFDVPANTLSTWDLRKGQNLFDLYSRKS